MSEELKKKQSAADMEIEFKALELEAKRLEVLDLKERVDERKLKREYAVQNSRTNGVTLAQQSRNESLAQARCNHHKGGDGADGVVSGQGADPQYCVLKHKFANGDVWVRCTRCGKTWKPPLRDRYKTDEEYNKVFAEYKEAIAFYTRNIMSASIAFTFSDGGVRYREAMANTTLR